MRRRCMRASACLRAVVSCCRHAAASSAWFSALRLQCSRFLRPGRAFTPCLAGGCSSPPADAGAEAQPTDSWYHRCPGLEPAAALPPQLRVVGTPWTAAAGRPSAAIPQPATAAGHWPPRPRLLAGHRPVVQRPVVQQHRAGRRLRRCCLRQRAGRPPPRGRRWRHRCLGRASRSQPSALSLDGRQPPCPTLLV